MGDGGCDFYEGIVKRGGRVIHRLRMGNEEGNSVYMPQHTKREREG